VNRKERGLQGDGFNDSEEDARNRRHLRRHVGVLNELVGMCDFFAEAYTNGHEDKIRVGVVD
jgi:hypothetical protein